MTLTPAAFAATVDHTVLKPAATVADVERVVAEALQYGFAAVCVAPCFVPLVSARLKGSAVKVCTVVGFPHGTSRSTVKAIEATVAVKDGAEEVDVVASLPALARADVAEAKAELIEVVKACRAVRSGVVVKVIVESAYLLSLPGDAGAAAIAAACRTVRESGCDFIKTSTGFHPAGGATVAAIRLMREHGEGLRVKASGGIRDLPNALALLNAGADRLGMSASVEVFGALSRSDNQP